MSWVARARAAQYAARVKQKLFVSLTDQFIESYVCWREACEDVRAAYESWRRSAPPERRLAFASYRAALDREAHAAHVYSHWTERRRSVEA